jgi:hypothetical protein
MPTASAARPGLLRRIGVLNATNAFCVNAWFNPVHGGTWIIEFECAPSVAPHDRTISALLDQHLGLGLRTASIDYLYSGDDDAPGVGPPRPLPGTRVVAWPSGTCLGSTSTRSFLPRWPRLSPFNPCRRWWLVGGVIADEGPQHIHATSGEGEQGVPVGLALAALPVVVGAGA